MQASAVVRSARRARTRLAPATSGAQVFEYALLSLATRQRTWRVMYTGICVASQVCAAALVLRRPAEWWCLACSKALTTTAFSAVTADQDESQRWVKYLERPLPQLPRTRAAVEAVLFPTEPGIRIPVQQHYYNHASLRFPDIAEQVLQPADAHSALPFSMTGLLTEEWDWASTEAHTTVYIVPFIKKVLKSLTQYSSHRIPFTVLLNSTEQRSASSSRTVQPKVRPDTVVSMNKCTFLLGEDKASVLVDAINDLKSKRVNLKAAHYGQVQFLLAYAAAGKEFQWFWMSSDGAKVSVVSLCSAHVQRVH